LPLFAAGAVGSALFSVLLYHGIDRPVQALRRSVKSRGFVWRPRKLEIAPGT